MDKAKKIAAAVVLYNVNCRDSLTCKGLREVSNDQLQIIIYDNSTSNYHNQEYCAQEHWTYLGGSGNTGLSKAYNAIIDYVSANKSADLICLFDDDTCITPDYFHALQDSVGHTGRKIFVPLIYSENMLISPSKIFSGNRIRLFKSEQEAMQYNGENLTAINSCMALDISLFQNYRYDENIFLDGIDHHFLEDMKKRGEKIQIFSYCCQHEFSGTSHPSKSAALNRFKIFQKNFNYIFRANRFAYHWLIAKRVLNLTWQYRSFDFIKISLNKAGFK